MESEPLAAAYRHSGQRDWSAAAEAFAAAPPEELGARDHVQWGMALYWQKELDDAIAEFEAAAHLAQQAGDIATEGGALRVLVQVASWAERDAVAATATARLGVLVEDAEEESEIHAFWQWGLGRVLAENDTDTGYVQLEEALATALRVRSRSAEALALTSLSQLDSMQCRVEEAIRKVDAAAALALSGEVHDMVAGGVLCGIQFTCRNVGDWERAAQWNEVAQRWAERSSVSVFPGLCHFHRCEVLRFRGALVEAELEAAQACEELGALAPAGGLGFGYRELGTCRLLRGDEAGAEEAFGLAVDHGVDPNPGLALLRLRRGDVASAIQGLRTALDLIGAVAFERPFLLPTLVTASLAGGDHEGAHEAAEELADLAERVGSDAHRAAADQARAEVTLARADLESARTAAHRAWNGWRSIGGLYDAARARETIGRIEVAGGRPEAAAFELESAARGYAQVGATPDVERVERAVREIRGGSETPTARAFMFTDIVDSTPLQSALGDERWLTLLDWHDRALRDAFAGCGGEVVKHEGDGFFVSFPTGADALRAGCRIQEELAAHRRDAGFALDVRIGVHEGTATPRDGDWIGANVTLAARVAATASAGEVVCTDAVLESAPRARVAERRALTLKGIDGEVAASLIEACH